jgi:uncharacterized membrane protein YkoI
VEGSEMEKAKPAKLISELQAIDIAESVVEGSVGKMKLDGHGGLYVYELELKTINGKAEIEVNAQTGDVLKKEVEFSK